jgi:hypothetical protein
VQEKVVCEPVHVVHNVDPEAGHRSCLAIQLPVDASQTPHSPQFAAGLGVQVPFVFCPLHIWQLPLHCVWQQVLFAQNPELHSFGFWHAPPSLSLQV